ncbi:MAG: hypothetical protein AB1Z98_39255 [Nannocystaceae bacterium]
MEHFAEQSHPVLRRGCGAAFSVDDGSTEVVVIVMEARSSAKPELSAAMLAIRAAVAAGTQLQVHSIALVAAGSIPKTTSGKVPRSLCRRRLLHGELQLLDSWSLGGSAHDSDEHDSRRPATDVAPFPP